MSNDAPRKRVAILGAGPAGLALGLRLLRRGGVDVTLIDLKPHAGGLASSFERDGLYFDHGSHRLHPATSPELMADIRGLLGDDLLERPRHGRISLLGRFVKFPLSPVNLALNLPPSFVLRFGLDLLTKPLRKKNPNPRSFAEAVSDGLGQTMCREFYFPYARKLWGLDPEELSVIQAQKRVSADSIGKLIRKMLSLVPGFKQPGAGIFYYPRKGYGQISDAMAAEIGRLGGTIRLSTLIKEVHVGGAGDEPIRMTASPFDEETGPDDAASETIETDFVFSTIPVTVLAKLLQPAAPPEVRSAVGKLGYRAMVIHYLVLDAGRFTEYDAHYFPAENCRFSRLSETKNYYNSTLPAGRTGLCFEIPCAAGDEIWNGTPEHLTEVCKQGMAASGLPIDAPVVDAFSRRVPQVYPTYDIGFEKHFAAIDRHLTGVPRLVPLGRQALFAHDNTHHTMEMAYRAADCLGDDLSWDEASWATHREAFEKHVVVD
ncbi:MAG: FAD-dependent oxidoreductase [Planctomycetota bacterium]